VAGCILTGTCLGPSGRISTSEISTRVRAQTRFVFGNGLSVRRDLSPSSAYSYVVVGPLGVGARRSRYVRRWRPVRYDLDRNGGDRGGMIARRLGGAPIDVADAVWATGSAELG
jgi:hypothetical protein